MMSLSIPQMKIFNTIFVLIVLNLFPNHTVLLNILICMGQAHFFMTYLYQYKSNKFDRLYLLKAALFIMILITYYLFFLNDVYIMKFTSVLFVFHFIFDEFYLDRQVLQFNQIYKVVPILLSYFVFIFGSKGEYIIIVKIGAVLSVLYYTLMVFSEKKYHVSQNVYLLIYSILCVSSIFSDWISIKNNAMFFIVIVHYLNWYSFNYSKFKNSKKALSYYFVSAILVNLVFGLLWVGFYFYSFEVPQLVLIFSPTCFYLWTLLHLFVTFRPNDIKLLIVK